jgi:hypothetical protein
LLLNAVNFIIALTLLRQTRFCLPLFSEANKSRVY